MSVWTDENAKAADDYKNWLDMIIESSGRLDPTQRYSGLRIDEKYNPMIQMPTTERLNALTNQYFDTSRQNINRDIAGAGQQGASRGYSMGLTNPFAFAQHAENRARGALGDLEGDRARQMMQNPLTSFQAGSQATQFNTGLLLQLLGMKGGNIGNYSGGILPGVVGGLGAIGGAILGGPMGAGIGSSLGGIFGGGGGGYQTDMVDNRQYA